MCPPNYPDYHNFANGYNLEGAAPRQMERLNAMRNMQRMQTPAYQQPLGGMQPLATPSYLSGRAVTGIEEARAILAPLDGSPIFMPSINEGKIYVKYLDLNGSPVFQTYIAEKASQSPAQIPGNAFEELQQRVAKLEARMGGNSNAQSNSNSANGNEQQQPDGNA